MTYLEQMFARQAVQAGQAEAARSILQRLRDTVLPHDAKPAAEPTPGLPAAAAVEPDAGQIPAAASAQQAGLTEPDVSAGQDRQWEAALAAAAAEPEGPEAELLRRLEDLAQPVPGADSGRMLPELQSSAAAQSYEALLLHRLSRAVELPTATTARELPSEGVRAAAPGGQADAAALSRLYERDARRYDGGFELPL